MDLDFLWRTFRLLVQGLPLTLELAATSIGAGLVLALLIALVTSAGGRTTRAMAQAYVFVFRGSPLLLQIFLVYYGLGQFRPTLQVWGLWPILREPYWCAVIALTLNTAAYGSEIFRGALQTVPAGPIEAGRACGMTGLLLFRRIVFPIALRQALPAYGNEMILMVKATALASTITLMEVTGLAGKLIAETFRTLEVFVVAGAIYLALNFLLTRAIMAAEHYLNPHLRPRAADAIATGTAHI